MEKNKKQLELDFGKEGVHVHGGADPDLRALGKAFTTNSRLPFDEFVAEVAKIAARRELMRTRREVKYLASQNRRQSRLHLTLIFKVLGLITANRRRRYAPGERMLDIASSIFSNKKIDQVFKPLVDDYRIELQEAVESGSKLKILAVKTTHRLAFCKACGLDKILDWIERIIKIASL